VRAWLFRRRIDAWASLPEGSALARALRERPALLGAIEAPYLNARWEINRRLDAIEEHYLTVASQSLQLLTFAAGDHRLLASLDDIRTGLAIVLDKAAWMAQEGEVVMSLFLNEERLFALAFSLGTQDGCSIAFVGAVQGRKPPDALRIYRQLTKQAHGLRPRELLVEAFRVFCASIGVARILGVDNSACQRRSPYFGQHAREVYLDYDETWRLQGGHAIGDGFYEVPVGRRKRAPETIASRKRAQYRRREAMLDRLDARIRWTLARAATVPARSATSGPDVAGQARAQPLWRPHHALRILAYITLSLAAAVAMVAALDDLVSLP
jgi:uncharacterized protein VirK/YbjX